MKTLTEKIEDILRPAIDVRAPYARHMIRALENLLGEQVLEIADYDASRIAATAIAEHEKATK